jgi:hypothetical protein
VCSISDKLIEISLHAALSSIEIYNKPDFRYREQIFTILNVNSWELLLKAKILKDNSDNLESIYIKKNDGSFKINRIGNPMTIDILGAMNLLSLDSNISNNIEKFIEIRDTAIHFYNDESLSYVVYTLGVASLRNYQKLITDWFDKSLLKYNFYILPLGFAYNFKTLSILELEDRPTSISNLLKSVSQTQSSETNSDFHFICEVSTKIVSAKKFTQEADLVTTIDKESNPDAIIVERLQRLIDVYPFSYQQVLKRVKEARPGVKQGQIDKIIRDNKLKENDKYCGFNFRTKLLYESYLSTGKLPKSITCIYKENTIRFILEHIK